MRFHPHAALASFALVTSTLAAAENPPAGGNVAHGQALFQQTCALCHATNAATALNAGQGPSLINVVGRKAAGGPAFPYTPALKQSGLVWNAATLDHFLTNPTLAVPGTNMVVIVPDAGDRRDLISYLFTVVGEEPVAAAPSNFTDAMDWSHAAPGKINQIRVAALPAPFASASSRNNPDVVPPPANAKLSVPPGFTVKLFARNLDGGPRQMRVAPNGDIFIAETRSNRIRVMRAADGAETPSISEIFIGGLDRPFGVAFYPSDGNPQWLYIANNNSVVRVPYKNGDLKASAAPQVIVPKLSNTTNGHSTRDVAFTPDGRRMLISVGSASNFAEGISKKTPEEAKRWDAEHGLGAAWDAELHRANVLVTDPEGKAPLKVYASGIRNPVGFAIDPVKGDLWTSCNERDGLGDNLVPDYVTSVKEGNYYGWPWYYMGRNEEPRLAGHRPDLAGKATVPDVPLQAHSASLGIVFYTATSGPAVFPAEYRNDLFVALHGSWNRASRTGYKVIRVRRENGVPTGAYEDFLTGFVVNGQSVWGRPVGVAVAHDGALLVTEDGNGTMWRITPNK